MTTNETRPTRRPARGTAAPGFSRWCHRPALAFGAAALLALLGCSGETVNVIEGGRDVSAALPEHTTIVVPTGWTGDLAAMVDDTISAVSVLAVDPAGRTALVVDADLSDGGASNEALAQANRAAGIALLASATIPEGSGFGDVLAGARAAFESGPDPTRVVSAATGCLDVGGQRLTNADLSSEQAISAAADIFASAGVLRLPSAEDSDVLVLAGLGSCGTNGVDNSARLLLAERMCADAEVACIAREAEVTR